MNNYNNEILQQYLHEMREYPLLNQEDEHRLVGQVQAGQQARTEMLAEAAMLDPEFSNAELFELSWTTQGYPDDEAREKAYGSSQELSLTAEQAIRYAVVIELGQRATEQMINSNLRLVVSIAKTFQGKGLPLLDLIQEGNFALGPCAKNFNPDYGFKFSTYTSTSIRRKIKRALAKHGGSLSVPEDTYDERYLMQSVSGEFFEDHNRFPTNAELAAELKWTEEEVRDKKHCHLRAESVSLSQSLGEEGTTSEIGELLPFEEVGFTAVDRERQVQDIKAIIKENLSEREAAVIEHRFFGKLSQEKAGSKIGISSKLVRRAEQQAIARLKEMAHELGWAYDGLTVSLEDLSK